MHARLVAPTHHSYTFASLESEYLLGGMHLVLQVELPNVRLELLNVRLALLQEQQVELFDVALRCYHIVTFVRGERAALFFLSAYYLSKNNYS